MMVSVHPIIIRNGN